MFLGNFNTIIQRDRTNYAPVNEDILTTITDQLSLTSMSLKQRSPSPGSSLLKKTLRDPGDEGQAVKLNQIGAVGGGRLQASRCGQVAGLVL